MQACLPLSAPFSFWSVVSRNASIHAKARILWTFTSYLNIVLGCLGTHAKNFYNDAYGAVYIMYVSRALSWGEAVSAGM